MSKNDSVLEYLKQSKAALQFCREVALKMATENNRPDLHTDFVHYADLLTDAGILTRSDGLYRINE